MAEIPEFTTRPELAGTFGMVASTHWLASAAGMAVLEHGGNAFDAAVAAGLVLQVVEPHLNGPGGEVPVIAHHAGRSEEHTSELQSQSNIVCRLLLEKKKLQQTVLAQPHGGERAGAVKRLHDAA